MIIGTANIQEVELVKHANSQEVFMEYAKSLVPEGFRHVGAIVANQCYICCLQLRKSDNVPWDRKKTIIEATMEQIRITGFTDCLIECNTLWGMADKKRVDQYLKKGGVR